MCSGVQSTSIQPQKLVCLEKMSFGCLTIISGHWYVQFRL